MRALKALLISLFLLVPVLAQAQCLYGSLERQWTQEFSGPRKGHDQETSEYLARWKGSLIAEQHYGVGDVFARASLVFSDKSPREFAIGYRVPIWCQRPCVKEKIKVVKQDCGDCKGNKR